MMKNNKKFIISNEEEAIKIFQSIGYDFVSSGKQTYKLENKIELTSNLTVGGKRIIFTHKFDNQEYTDNVLEIKLSIMAGTNSYMYLKKKINRFINRYNHFFRMVTLKTKAEVVSKLINSTIPECNACRVGERVEIKYNSYSYSLHVGEKLSQISFVFPEFTIFNSIDEYKLLSTLNDMKFYKNLLTELINFHKICKII